MRALLPSILVVACACCAQGSGDAVRVPSMQPSPGAASSRGGAPVACGKPWTLEVIGGGGRVVVACPDDVQRLGLDQSSTIARALSPALDPLRERVCSCVARLPAPDFVDLVLTAKPEEGRVTAQAGADEDLDPDVGPAFVACIGSVVATFAPVPSEVCSNQGRASFVYPVRLELAP